MQTWIKKLLLILAISSIAHGGLVETDFSEYTTGQPLSDWTERWETSDVSTIVQAGTWEYTIGKELYLDNNVSQRYLATWDDLDGTTDCDVIALVKTAQTASQGIRIFCRASGATDSETGYFVVTLTDEIRIGMYDDGVASTLTSVPFHIEHNAYYWFRFQVIGTALKVKVWSYNEIEPADWTLEDTDSTISSGGWVGIGASSAVDTYYYYFACDTSGTTATIPDAYTGCDTFSMLLPNIQNTTAVNWTRVIGGLMPSGQTWDLTGAEIYCGATHTSQVRVAVYTGGTLADGPDGATLLYDFGQTAGVATDEWIELACSAVEIPANAALWIAVKGNDSGFGIVYSNAENYGSHGNFQRARGRFLSNTVSTDETSAYPNPWPADGGSFADYWCGWKIIITATEEEEGGGGQVIMIEEF